MKINPRNGGTVGASRAGSLMSHSRHGMRARSGAGGACYARGLALVAISIGVVSRVGAVESRTNHAAAAEARVLPAPPASAVSASEIKAQVEAQVEARPEVVLAIVDAQITAHPASSCEIVKAAIVASKASPPQVAQIVETAIMAAPDHMRMIAQCALAVAPDALPQVQAVLAELDPATGEGGRGAKSSKDAKDSKDAQDTKDADAVVKTEVANSDVLNPLNFIFPQFTPSNTPPQFSNPPPPNEFPSTMINP